MEQRIAEILRANFEGAQVNLGRDSRKERINGTLLWNGFAGHDFLWRQNRIFRVLRRELGKARGQEAAPGNELHANLRQLAPLRYF